jgi:predicted metal-dependent phosphoesterase TrpH
MHTSCSDGTDSPLELLKKSAHLPGLSITDHDTIDAYTPEFFSLADSLEIEILIGVEISSEDSVHILGYGLQATEPFSRYLASNRKKKRERNREILKKLAKEGMRCLEEELYASGSEQTIGRPHIADLLVKKGYLSHPEEAFSRLIGEGKRCYVPGMRPSHLEVIGAIHEAGGKAVIAHPHFLKKGALKTKLFSLPFDGIECFYGNFPASQNASFQAIAKKKGWIATGGSDYHGTRRPQVYPGCNGVDRFTFDALRKPF